MMVGTTSKISSPSTVACLYGEAKLDGPTIGRHTDVVARYQRPFILRNNIAKIGYGSQAFRVNRWKPKGFAPDVKLHEP